MVATNVKGKTRDKQSLQYIIRSGLAGGVAGCVVRLVWLYNEMLYG